MTKVLLFSCKRIRDTHCIACAKCSKAARLTEGEFSRYEQVHIVGNSQCGDCPGLIMPRIGLVMKVLDGLEERPDAIHLSTCLKVATETAQCPLDLEKIKATIEEKLSIPVVIGTHPYL